MNQNYKKAGIRDGISSILIFYLWSKFLSLISLRRLEGKEEEIFIYN